MSDLKKIQAAQQYANSIGAQLSAQEAQQVQADVYIWRPKEFDPFGSSASLVAWKGKYPFDRVKGYQFFEVPEISVRVQAALGEDAVKTMKSMATTGPVDEKDGWLVASGCTPHACIDRWGILINLKTYDVFACLREYGGSAPAHPTEIFGGTGFQRVKQTLGSWNDN